MLSEYERRQLALIEEGFAEEDARVSGRRPATPWTRRRWMARALLGFGVALLVLGLLTAADGLFMQGVLFGGIGIAWLRWQHRAARSTPGTGGVRRSSADGRARPL